MIRGHACLIFSHGNVSCHWYKNCMQKANKYPGKGFAFALTITGGNPVQWLVGFHKYDFCNRWLYHIISGV